MLTTFRMPAVTDAAPLVPGRPEDRATNARGVLSPAQEQWLGALLSVPRVTQGGSTLAATGQRFAAMLAQDLAGSSVVTKTGMVEWAPAGTAPWQLRPGYIARVDGERDPSPIFGAALPGRYVLYTLPVSGAVVGIDAPGQNPLTPTEAHRAAYEALVASVVGKHRGGRGGLVFWLLTAILAAIPAALVTFQPTGSLAVRLLDSAPMPIVLGTLWAVPALALAIAGASMLVARRRPPETITGPLTVEARAATPGDEGLETSPVVHPLESVWSAPTPMLFTIRIGGRAVIAKRAGLARMLVPGVVHRAELDPKRDRLLRLGVA